MRLYTVTVINGSFLFSKCMHSESRTEVRMHQLSTTRRSGHPWTTKRNGHIHTDRQKIHTYFIHAQSVRHNPIHLPLVSLSCIPLPISSKSWDGHARAAAGHGTWPRSRSRWAWGTELSLTYNGLDSGTSGQGWSGQVQRAGQDETRPASTANTANTSSSSSSGSISSTARALRYPTSSNYVLQGV
jgi:hypothetical protein